MTNGIPGWNAPSLLGALADSEQDAFAAWTAWRDSVDMQNLAWKDMQILPVLNGPRLEAWLAGDPEAGILKGIVRRAWSEAQMRLGQAREIVQCLDRAGCGPATWIGPLGAYLRNLQSTAIRPVLELRVLISRHRLAAAATALGAEGWQLRDILPTGIWLDRMTHLFFARDGTRLHLYWRLLPTSTGKTRHVSACEREFQSEYRMVEAAGASFRILAPCHALLEALTDPEENVDALAWQADAMLLLRQRELREAIDWPRWARLAARFQPLAFAHLAELRSGGLPVPALEEPTAGRQLVLAAEAWLEAASHWTRRFRAAEEER